MVWQKKKTVIIILLLLFGTVSTPVTIRAASSMMTADTTVAGIVVDDLATDDVKQKLKLAISDWKKGQPIILKSDYEQLALPRDVFRFNIPETMKELNKKTKHHLWSIFMKHEKVHINLHVKLKMKSDSLVKLLGRSNIHKKQLKRQLLHDAATLTNDDIAFTYVNQDQLPLQQIAMSTIDVSNQPEFIVDQICDELDGLHINPKSTFSYLENLSLYESLRDFSANDAVTSGLYQAFLQTNFMIVERHYSRHQPYKGKVGMEAVVDTKPKHDLAIYNPNRQTFILNAKQDDKHGLISITISSLYDGPTYQPHVESEKVNFRTIYRYDKNMAKGKSAIVRAGTPGLRVETSRVTKDNQGHKTMTPVHDTYLSVPEIVLTSDKEEMIEHQKETVEDEKMDRDIQTMQAEIQLIGNYLLQIDGRYESTSDEQQKLKGQIEEAITEFNDRHDNLQKEMADQQAQLQEELKKQQISTANHLDSESDQNIEFQNKLSHYQDEISKLEQQLKQLTETDGPKQDEGDDDAKTKTSR